MKLVLWGIMVAVVLTLFGCVLSYVGVIGNIATAPARVANQTLSTENILTSYDQFFAFNQNYTARLADIKNYEQLSKEETDPGQKRADTENLFAMKSSCREIVTKYNASAEKLTSAFFKDSRLPSTLDINNCEG